jgi:hypothetical protein
MRTLPQEILQFGRLGQCNLALLLACLSGEAGDNHIRAVWMCDHGTPGVKSSTPRLQGGGGSMEPSSLTSFSQGGAYGAAIGLRSEGHDT